jgi:predicted anti-sigma-YlaC factor YlaD
MTARHHGHPTEDDLILHFYAEDAQPAAIQRHLAACERCAAEYDTIAGTLKLVAAPPIPERGDLYGLEVWQRIRPLLPAREPWWRMSALRWKPLTLSAVVTALTISAFVAGRYWAPTARPASSARTAGVPANADERARTVALVDHLERSERVLLDLSHAEGPDIDVTSQQAWAADLVEANRLYRESAAQAGETTIASVLDDLERSLLDIVHAPSKLTPAELDDVRTRLDGAALLFKVRVLSNELRERETAPIARRKTT